MSWCPKCGSEYQPEVDVCPECGTAIGGAVKPAKLAKQAIEASGMMPAVGLSIGLVFLSVALLIGLAIVMTRVPGYDPDSWDVIVFGCTAPVCAIVGFACSRLRKRPMQLIGSAIGWLVPWTIIGGLYTLAYWQEPDMGSVINLSVLPATLMFLVWTTTSGLAGMIGAVLGAQWKERRDWLRMIAFCVTLAVLVWFWATLFSFTIVAKGYR